MKTNTFTVLILLLFLHQLLHASGAPDLQVVQEYSLGQPVGKLRAVPVQISPESQGILLVYSEDGEIDPYVEMFFPPKHPVVFAMYSTEGELLWKESLGAGNLNGIWFLPVFPFDLDGDGSEEIYFVNNTDPNHVLSLKNRRLEAMDAGTGEPVGNWPFPTAVYQESLSHTFRLFILGGFVDGQPVLVTGHGTYGRMGLNAWNPGMELRWELVIEEDRQTPRGSHMCPVVDWNSDGKDELFWGERCVSIDDGSYLFIADENVYRGHSDVIQPTRDRKSGQWMLFTCRESGDQGPGQARVVMFDQGGQRIWADLESGHMDAGWTAHLKDPDLPILAFTIRLQKKVAGPDGFFRTGVEEFAYEAHTGKPHQLPFNGFNTVPVDLDGDGYHEFACATGEQADGRVYDTAGRVIAHIGENGIAAMASRFLDLPGEQLFCYYPDGMIRIWADPGASSSPVAAERYRHPYYKSSQRLTATGYNIVNLGGL